MSRIFYLRSKVTIIGSLPVSTNHYVANLAEN